MSRVDRILITLTILSFFTMLPQLIPSTESGLYSRILIYRIARRTDYQSLTSGYDSIGSLRHFDNLAQRVLDMAIYLEKSPTFVSFSDKQCKLLDRYFEREYNNVRVFGTDDVASEVLDEARVRGISRAGVFRMLKKAQEYGLLISPSIGCYQKTEKGKNVKN